MKTKVFAAYLPQYHETEDNNVFWGKGYTDWVGVKKAKPQFKGHIQPKVPLNENYYDLTNYESILWQANLAKKYGIDGFNIYHYWFKDGKQELEKPAEILLRHKEINIEFFFTWDNASWKRTWGNIQGNDWAPAFDKKMTKSGSATLVEFQLGGKSQWKAHFDYLLDFFRDDRYYKISGKPVFMLIGRNEEKKLQEMGEYWNTLAIEAGFDGMYFATKRKNFFGKPIFDADFSYEPETSAWGKRRAVEKRIQTLIGVETKRDEPVKYIYDYEKVWKKIIKNAKKNVSKQICGCFVRYDDTPRRGKDAMIIRGESPNLFEHYFKKYYEIMCKGKVPFILITAWNEWGEGAYLEPDEKDKYAYLEALKRAIDTVN